MLQAKRGFLLLSGSRQLRVPFPQACEISVFWKPPGLVWRLWLPRDSDAELTGSTGVRLVFRWLSLASSSDDLWMDRVRPYEMPEQIVVHPVGRRLSRLVAWHDHQFEALANQIVRGTVVRCRRPDDREASASTQPLMTCGAPESLSIRPADRRIFTATDILHCLAFEVSADSPQVPVIWTWRLGPLPSSSENLNVPRLLRDSHFRLHQLPAPGYYEYRCNASLTCGRMRRSFTVWRDIAFIYTGDQTSRQVLLSAELKPRLMLPGDNLQLNCQTDLSLGLEKTGVVKRNLVFHTYHSSFELAQLEAANEVLLTRDRHQTTWSTGRLRGRIFVTHHRLAPLFRVDLFPVAWEDYGYYGCATELAPNTGLVKVRDSMSCIFWAFMMSFLKSNHACTFF
ncbi:unnamed protein product [Protopolystoma xenopodis]|uniref:Ig-like domain-containing protein n=1 Tax=Protopolystoma xenopodis TaxID=117903 RepID=A0A448WBJ7_9PLAT|nr:unnamed protein product [Protopolystoma xenopodis]